MDVVAASIAAVSAVVSSIELIYRHLSLRIERGRHELALEQHRQRQPDLRVYLADAYYVRSESKPCRIYAFHLTIGNASHEDNCVRDITLTVEHGPDEGPSCHLVLSHDRSLATLIRALEVAAFHIPATVAAHETLDGYALFPVHDHLVHESPVQSYTLKLIDSHGIETQINPIFVNERHGEGLCGT